MLRIILMIIKNLFRIPALYGKLCKYAKNRENHTAEEMSAHIRKILDCAIKAGDVTVQVHGRENIPTENGFLMYGNHQGMFDILAIVANCPNPIGAVYKIELEGKPLVSQISDCTYSFAMDRDDVRQSLQVMSGVTEKVKEGRNYVIFPEGTRSKMGNKMGEFHHGSFRCALKARCPIVPVAVIDSYKVLDQKGIGPVSMQLHYLEPIPFEEYKTLKTPQIAELVKARIEETIEKYA